MQDPAFPVLVVIWGTTRPSPRSGKFLEFTSGPLQMQPTGVSSHICNVGGHVRGHRIPDKEIQGNSFLRRTGFGSKWFPGARSCISGFGGHVGDRKTPRNGKSLKFPSGPHWLQGRLAQVRAFPVFVVVCGSTRPQKRKFNEIHL